MITDCIKEGFKLANKNLQLVLIRIIVTIINIALFLIFLGVPLFVGIVYMGLDLANAKDLLPQLMNNPFVIMSRYLGLALLLAVSIVIYLFAASMIYLYLLGGTLGVLKNSGVNMQYRFSISSFFREGRGNFWPLFRLISLLLLGFIIVLTVFSIGGGIIAALTGRFAGAGGSFDVFISSFILLSVIVIAFIVFFAGFVFFVYSVLASVIEGLSAAASVKKSLEFLKSSPKAFLLLIVLILGIVIVNILFILLKMPFSLAPFLGTVMNIMLSIVNAFIQSYMVIVMWGSVVVSYLRGTKHPVYSGSYEI